MNKEIIRFCAHCGDVIPDSRNGNSKFCKEECYDKNKAIIAAQRTKSKAEKLLLLNNDDIIHDLYRLRDPTYPLSAKELTNRDFNWSVHAGEEMRDNLIIKNMIRYGYTLFNNQTVQLWKL